MFYGYYKKGSEGFVRKSKVHIFHVINRTLCGAYFYLSGGRQLVNLGDIDSLKLNISLSDICKNCNRSMGG